MASSPNPALDGESKFGVIVAILTVGCVASTLAVGLRLWCRGMILGTFGHDDTVMAFAQLITIGAAVAEGLESQYGLGRHTWTMPADNYVPYMKSFYSSVVTYNIATCLVKLSILLQYRRIFPTQMIQRLTAGGLIFLGLWTVTLAFLLTLVCMPVAKFWDPTIEGRCLDQLAIWYVMASVNLVTDLAVFTMPLPVVGSLQLPRRQKFMLVGVFALGFFTCAISIYRIQTLRTASTTQDPTWDNVGAATWSFLELTVGVLAACLPTLRPIFTKILPRLFGSSGSASRTGNPEYANSRSRATHWPPAKLSIGTDNSRGEPTSSTEDLRRKGDVESGYYLTELNDKSAPRTGPYSVAVIAGGQGSDVSLVSKERDSGDRHERHEIHRGITATTVVSQQVEVRKGGHVPGRN